MGKAKNIFWGLMWMLFSIAMYVVIPILTLNAAKTFMLSDIATLDAYRLNIDDVIFFIQSLGIVQAGLAFAKGSSPNYSKRKAMFSFLSFWGSGAYLYIIKFSGLSQIPITLTGLGSLTVTFTDFVYMVAGIVVLNAVLAIIDIIIAIMDQRYKTVYSLDKERKERETEEITPEVA
jgi:hypothetical protein